MGKLGEYPLATPTLGDRIAAIVGDLTVVTMTVSELLDLINSITFSALAAETVTAGDATGTVKIAATLGYLAEGQATQWDDIVIPWYSLSTGQTPPDSINLFGTNYLKGIGFDGLTTTEDVQGFAEITHSWKQGSTVDVHIHWSPADIAHTGTVTWNAELWSANMSIAGTPTVFAVLATMSGSHFVTNTNETWTHVITGLGLLPLPNLKIGAQIVLRLWRNPQLASDTYEGDAALLSIGIHFEQDTMGSKDRVTK